MDSTYSWRALSNLKKTEISANLTSSYNSNSHKIHSNSTERTKTKERASKPNSLEPIFKDLSNLFELGNQLASDKLNNLIIDSHNKCDLDGKCRPRTFNIPLSQGQLHKEHANPVEEEVVEKESSTFNSNSDPKTNLPILRLPKTPSALDDEMSDLDVVDTKFKSPKTKKHKGRKSKSNKKPAKIISISGRLPKNSQHQQN